MPTADRQQHERAGQADLDHRHHRFEGAVNERGHSRAQNGLPITTPCSRRLASGGNALCPSIVRASLMSRKSILHGMVLTAAALILAACGGDESTASKSAAAFREAQAKGVPVGGGHEHGGHAVATATATAAVPAVDHAAHGAPT